MISFRVGMLAARLVNRDEAGAGGGLNQHLDSEANALPLSYTR
jgi:hypothetical protein